MKIHLLTLTVLAGLFYSLPIYAQFDFSPLPDYTTSPQKLNKFIRDSIEGHQNKIDNIGTPHKYCLPHICANRKGKYALAGFDHQPVTAFEFDDITGKWHDNAYIVRKGNLHGCIDTTGKWLLPVQYPQLYFSYPGRLICSGVDHKRASVFNLQGQPVLPEPFLFAGTMDWGSRTVIKARIEFGDSLYLFDLSGNKIITSAAYDIKPLHHENGNRYVVKSSPDMWSDKEMLVDSNFQLIAPPRTGKIDWSNDTWVYYNSANAKGELYSIAAQSFHPVDGNIKPFKYHSSLMVSTQARDGILNDKLQLVVRPQFVTIEHVVGHDLFIVRNFNFKFGLMDGKGKLVLDTVYPLIEQAAFSFWDKQRKELGADELFIPTDFLKIVDQNRKESCYDIAKKVFIENCSQIVPLTSDLYLKKIQVDWHEEAYLMHRDGRKITKVTYFWVSGNLLVAVKKDDNNPQVQIYDRHGDFIRALDSSPVDMEVPNKKIYKWVTKDNKMGVLDANFNPLIPPVYDMINNLSIIPQKNMNTWIKYNYRHPKHTFLGWIWNSDKTIPLLIKENGELVSIVELN